jgi:hypothetical protein
MVSPLKFIGIAIVAFWGTLLIFICISLALQSEDNNVTSYVTINDYDSETVKNTLLSGLSPDEEISGYTRQVQTDGNLTFVCYTSTNDNCKSFPAMLIYAEYTGSREYAENAFEIFGSDDASFTSVSIGGIEGETNHWFTVSANPDSSGTFVINCYEYSDSSAQLVAQEGGDSAMGQYADDSGSFAFDLSEVFG